MEEWVLGPLEIAVDRLQDGHVEEITCELSPELFDLNEADLSFPRAISIEGRVYSTGDHLVLDYDATAVAELPCAICNRRVGVELAVEEGQAVEDIAHCLNGIWDVREVIREALLLELPPFVECEKGECPRRSEIEPYLKKQGGEQSYHPFADL